jgi:hypothetical protein
MGPSGVAGFAMQTAITSWPSLVVGEWTTTSGSTKLVVIVEGKSRN